ncbi:MAG: alpha/beta fold hydrolase [Pisciglobus halotolerans]|nr:alpha/beta fold hydrolase [Pisciglobus halotolerans]
MMKGKSFFFENGPKAVILFHAYSGDSNDVRLLGRALEKGGYTVYGPTFSGHGTGDLEDALQCSAEDWVADGKKAVSFLKEKGYNDIVVLGLSLGGVIATKMVLDEDVLAGGVFSSPLFPESGGNVGKVFLRRMLAQKEKIGDAGESYQRRLPELKEKLELRLKSIGLLVESMVPHYKEITKPMFVGQGGDDELIDSSTAYKTRDALENAEVDFHWYDGAGHVITVGASYKPLSEDVMNFLTNLQWNGG